MTPLRIGIIGAGSMGSLHARVVSACADTSLAWVSDTSTDTARVVAERYGVAAHGEPDLAAVDGIVIAASTPFHYDLAAAVLKSGVPVLVEKPLSDRLIESEDLIDLSADLDVPVMCGLLERFNPAVRTAFEIAEHPIHFRATRHSPYVERIRTGVASDLLIHDADLAIRLFRSPPVDVRSMAGFFHPRSEPSSEDIVETVMTFSDQQVASLSASRMSQRKVREMVIVEEERLIEVDLLRQDITIYRHVGGAMAIDDDGLGYRQQTIIDIPVVRYLGEPLALQLLHFVELIRGNVDADAERASIIASHRAVDLAVGAAGSSSA